MHQLSALTRWPKEQCTAGIDLTNDEIATQQKPSVLVILLIADVRGYTRFTAEQSDGHDLFERNYDRLLRST